MFERVLADLSVAESSVGKGTEGQHLRLFEALLDFLQTVCGNYSRGHFVFFFGVISGGAAFTF